MFKPDGKIASGGTTIGRSMNLERIDRLKAFPTKSRLSQPKISGNEQNDYNDTDNVKYVSSEHFSSGQCFSVVRPWSTTRV
jgi:hypothetical protein